MFKRIINIFLNEDFFHLTPVSTTPVANLELRVSPRIFEKFETTLMVKSGAWGKKPEAKNFVTLSPLANIRSEASLQHVFVCFKSNICMRICANIVKQKIRRKGVSEYTETFEYEANTNHIHLDSLRSE